MSKLADKIRRATRLQAPGIGFGAARATTEPTLVLAGMAKDERGAEDVTRRGADIVILEARTATPGERSSKDGAIAGARIQGRADNEAKAWKEAGYDFVVFDPDRATATALLEENIGYVLSAPADLSDTEWRTLEGFQLDAIDIGAIEGAMTVRRQIDLRRIYSMTQKPLMATVSGSISATELQALRDTNVVVIVAKEPGDVERLRKTVDALPARVRRKDADDRPVPLVPHNAMASGDEEHDHDE